MALSSKTEGGHDYRQHGRDLHAFIEALQLEDIILGGWSFGCLATLAYIHQYGADRLGGFVMLDGTTACNGRGQYYRLGHLSL